MASLVRKALLLLLLAVHAVAAQRVVVCEDREFDYWADFRNCLLVFLPQSSIAVAGRLDADPLAGVNDTYSRTVFCRWCRYPWVAHAEAYNDETGMPIASPARALAAATRCDAARSSPRRP